MSINRREVEMLTEYFNSKDYNIESILSALSLKKKSCNVFLGRELSEQEVQEKVNEFKNNGFCIFSIRTIDTFDGERNPEYKIPPETWAVISWN